MNFASDAVTVGEWFDESNVRLANRRVMGKDRRGNASINKKANAVENVVLAMDLRKRIFRRKLPQNETLLLTARLACEKTCCA